MAQAVIAIGSNIEPEKHLPTAIAALSEYVYIRAFSGVYETPPVGAPGTPPFLNMAVLVETDLTPAALRARVLRPIEQRLGRVRQPDPNAPRTIDLDLVLYREGGRVCVVDADVAHYAHVAIPVAEIAPDWPVQEHQRMADIAAQLREKSRAFRRRPDVEMSLKAVQI